MRHLVNRGRGVSVTPASDRLGDAAQHHLDTLLAMGVAPTAEPPDVPIVIDALVGYGLVGPLHGRGAELAAWSRGRHVVSLDLPSGLGHSGGRAGSHTDAGPPQGRAFDG